MIGETLQINDEILVDTNNGPITHFFQDGPFDQDGEIYITISDEDGDIGEAKWDVDNLIWTFVYE